jgi:hypothetical protein
MSEMGDRPVEAREASAEAPAEATPEAGESGPAEPAGDAPAGEGTEPDGQRGSDMPSEAGVQEPADTTGFEAGDAGPPDEAPAAAETDDSVPGTADTADTADAADLPAEELEAPGESGEAEPAGEAGENEPPAETGESEPAADLPLDDLVNTGAEGTDPGAETAADSAEAEQQTGEAPPDPVETSEPETTESVDAEAAATPESVAAGDGGEPEATQADEAATEPAAEQDSPEPADGEAPEEAPEPDTEQGEPAEEELPPEEPEQADEADPQDPEPESEPDPEFEDADGDQAPPAEEADPVPEEEIPPSAPGEEGGFAARPGEAGSPLAGEEGAPGDDDAGEQGLDDDATVGAAEPGEGDLASAPVDDATELGSRPSVADAHPEDYTAADHEPPAVDQPHESPEGWARDINHDETEPGRDNNCGECARAVQSTWEGDPATAAALSDPDANGENISRMVDWAESQPELASMSEINQRLDEMGPGCSAIIGCTWPDGRGHWFNAVNDGGSVKAVDGQSGSVEPWPPTEDGLGFNESQMDRSFAFFFDRDGKVAN